MRRMFLILLAFSACTNNRPSYPEIYSNTECDVVLYFKVKYKDGGVTYRTKWMSRAVAGKFVKDVTSPEFKVFAPELKVTDFVIKEVEPYDCNKGPKD